MENTWPDGKRRALTQSEHERWNSFNYPGTRQLCSDCSCATGYCEEDGITDDDGNPLCDDCAKGRGLLESDTGN
jgi:hypothetical protein